MTRRSLLLPRFLAMVVTLALGSVCVKFGPGSVVDAVVFWPMMLIARLFGGNAVPVNVGTPDAPVYEATPVHLFLGAVGFAMCVVYWWGVLAAFLMYRLRPWLRARGNEQ